MAGMTNPTALSIPDRTADGEIVGADFRARWAAQAQFADALAAHDDPAEIFAALVADFQAEHAQHRQYDGWTNGAVLVRATTRISGKGGVKAEAGDYLIGHYTPGLGFSPGSWTAYAPRVGWNLGGSLPVKVVAFTCACCGYVIGTDGSFVPGEIAHHPDCEVA